MGNQTDTRTNTMGRIFRYSRIDVLLLTLLLVGGFVPRVWNINFDQGVGSHPDERSTACFVAPTIGWPKVGKNFATLDAAR